MYGVRVHVRGVGFSVVPEIVVDLDRGEVSLLTMKGRDASLAREIICSLISCGVGVCVCGGEVSVCDVGELCMAERKKEKRFGKQPLIIILELQPSMISSLASRCGREGTSGHYCSNSMDHCQNVSSANQICPRHSGRVTPRIFSIK